MADAFEIAAVNAISCDSLWPACLYDFTLKCCYINFLAYRVACPLSTYLINGYFYSEMTSDYEGT